MSDLGFVYFIQAFAGGPIKIGYSQNPQARLVSIQTNHPQRLDLVGAVEGERDLERRLHESLAEWRLSGEWFKDSREVCDVVEALIAPAPSGDLLHQRVNDAHSAYVAEYRERHANDLSTSTVEATAQPREEQAAAPTEGA